MPSININFIIYLVKSALKSKIVLLQCICLILSLFISSLANSAESTDVRLIIDVSGSMKKNDANNLRRPAVVLLVRLLPDKSKAGVWTFGQYVNMLVPHGEVDDQWRDFASEKIAKINSNGLYTNIGEALEKAAYDTAYSASQNTMQDDQKSHNSGSPVRHLILLTDGMVDISKKPEENEVEWRRITDEILPSLKDANFKIHTIALSDNADTDLLNKLSLTTDGVAATANDADELMKIFLNALDSASPPEQVPLKGNTFVVDSSVEEFTALIFPKEGGLPARLKSPENKEYIFDEKAKDINWVRTDQYDLLTVQQPVEGEWKLLADLDPDSRVTIVSDLNLVVKPLPNNLLKGSSIDLTLLLEEGGHKIVRKDLLDIMDVSYSIQRHNDGEAWFDVMPIDLSLSSSDTNAGVFSKSLDIFNSVGIYEIRIVVDGKSFKREFSHSLEVREPFIVEIETQQKKSITHIVTKVIASNDDIDISKTTIVAKIEEPSDNSFMRELKLTNFDRWELDLIPEEQGIYTINIKVSAVNKKGETFDFSPEAIKVKYPEEGIFFEDPTEVKEPDTLPPIEAPAEMPTKALTENTNEEPKSKLWLYVGLGIGNLLILILAFLAYRMIMGKKGDSELDELEKLVEDKTKAASVDDKVSTEEKVPETENEEPSVAPSMAEVDSSEEKNTDEIALTKKSEANSSAEEINTSAADDAVEGVTDVEFSLDDFDDDGDDLEEGTLDAIQPEAMDVNESVDESLDEETTAKETSQEDNNSLEKDSKEDKLKKDLDQELDEELDEELNKELEGNVNEDVDGEPESPQSERLESTINDRKKDSNNAAQKDDVKSKDEFDLSAVDDKEDKDEN